MASHQLLLQKRLFILDVRPLTIAAKLSILDVRGSPHYLYLRTNQWTGFYMKGASIMEELMLHENMLQYWHREIEIMTSKNKKNQRWKVSIQNGTWESNYYSKN